jgi:cytochrome d ubiquinol oxidase subunit I
LVAVGTTFSAFWIVVLNSWMHTPAGFEMIDGVAHATDWAAIIFNPSMPYRLLHMLLASGLTVAFLMAGLAALRWLWGDRAAELRVMLRTGLVMAAALIPLQILAGDLHGLNTLEHQPQKVAAMEANWETQGNVPLVLFALPDEAARENRFEIAIPNGASLILTHSFDGVVPGLNDFIAEDGIALHPPVAPVFFSFRVMVATGFAMLFLSWGALAYMRRGRVAGEALSPEGLPNLMLYALVPMALSGWVATLAGWYTTEIGRQPWLVQGVVTTAEAVAEVPAPMVMGTLIVYLAIYAALLAAYVGVLVYLARKAAMGQSGARPARPQQGLAAALVAGE